MSDQKEPENNEISSPNSDMLRRDFLLELGGRALALAAVALAMGSGASRSSQNQTSNDASIPEVESPNARAPFEEYPLEPTEVTFYENSFFEFEGGERRIDLPGMGWYPDGHIPFVTLEDEQSKLMWITGHLSDTQGSFPYIWNPATGIHPQVNEKNEIIPAVTREQNETSQKYRNGYSGLTSVIPFNGGLLGFTHNEEWQYYNNGGGFKASVGIVYEREGEKSFEPTDIPISGRETQEPGKNVTGAGQPCVIKVKDQDGQEYAYIYYVEWLPPETKAKTGLVDQIYLSRVALHEGSLGVVEHLTWDEGFREIPSGEFANLKPVLTPPASIPGSNYAALPSISHNNVRNSFMAVFETDIGVCAAESDDAVVWGKPELIVGYPKPLSYVWQNPGSHSYSYPTLLDLTQSSDQKTGENPSLIMAKGIGSNSSHSMIAINGKIKLRTQQEIKGEDKKTPTPVDIFRTL